MNHQNKNEFPYEIIDVEPQIAEELMKHFTGEHTGFVRVGPKGYFFPHKYKQEALNIYSIEVKPGDIFIASYPRSGTTWTQELVWMVANDLDYATSDDISLMGRYIFLDVSVLVHPILTQRLIEENSHDDKKLKILEASSIPGTAELAAKESARFIKTHMPLSLLPPHLLDNAKMVYVARDPRDVAVSCYHFHRLLRMVNYIGDFKTFWNYFINDLHYWSPYFEHVKEAWNKREHPNMLFLFYEELSKDLPAAVHRVADFLNKKFTDEQVAKLCDHLSIENFKNNKSVNPDIIKELGMHVPGEQPFIRKGKVGDWRDYFDEEMTQQAEQWIADNLKDTDFRFPHLSQ